MFEGVLDSDQLQTGRRNIEGVRRSLAAAGVPVAGAETGGAVGRTLIVDVQTGAITCEVPSEGRTVELRRAA
jgi:chemotaxis receptor (MCP) glutamine deamidase CheD